MKIIIIIVCIICSLCSAMEVKNNCSNKEIKIPLGIVTHKVYHNKSYFGEKRSVFSKKKNLLITKHFFTLYYPKFIFTIKNEVVETVNFKPVSYTFISRLYKGKKIDENKVYKEKIVKAHYNGQNIIVMINGIRSTVKIKGKYYAPGRAMLPMLLKTGLQTGTAFHVKVFAPHNKISGCVQYIYNVLPQEEIVINRKRIKLFHVTHAIDNSRVLHYYVKKNGIVYKTVEKFKNGVKQEFILLSHNITGYHIIKE